MRLAAIATLACGLMVTSAQAQDYLKTTLQSRTTAGREVRVFTYATWTGDCVSSGTPTITVTVPPGHGTASVRPGNATITVQSRNSSDCLGKTVAGTGIWYQPAAGFRGADRFEYTVSTPGRRGGSEEKQYIGMVDVQ